MNIWQALKTVLWSFIGLGGGHKRGEDIPSNPLLLIAIALILALVFVGTLMTITKAVVAVS